MASASALTRQAALRKLIAGIGAPLVDATSDFESNGSGERGATRTGVVGAAHSTGVLGDFHTQTVRYLPALAEQLMGREVNPKAYTTGATSGAGRHLDGCVS